MIQKFVLECFWHKNSVVTKIWAVEIALLCARVARNCDRSCAELRSKRGAHFGTSRLQNCSFPIGQKKHARTPKVQLSTFFCINLPSRTSSDLCWANPLRTSGKMSIRFKRSLFLPGSFGGCFEVGKKWPNADKLTTLHQPV